MFLCKYGNDKVGEDTLLFNMGSATNCPSRDQCTVLCRGRTCYPAQVERHHPEVKAFRDRQESYWRSTPGEQIATDVLVRIGRRPVPVRYLRFNEAGDFWSQECIDKLSYVARQLRDNIGVTTYGFSARMDLDFSAADFLVKGSGHDEGNNGNCIVIGPDEPVPSGYQLCPENCRICSLCMQDSKVNIAFVERQWHPRPL
jgi:hypothetical protein